MDSLLFKIMLVSVLGFVSCKKETVNSNGQASALINGFYWESEVRIDVRYDKLNMILEKYKPIDGTNVPWEIMGIQYFDKTLEKQKVISSDSVKFSAPWDAKNAYGSFATVQDDGDVACDFYEIIENDSTNNWVRVDNQNGNYSEVWGSFSMHLYRTNTCNVSIYPDTLLISNGQFHFKM